MSVANKVAFTLGAESSNERSVTIQLKTLASRNLNNRVAVTTFLSEQASGHAVFPPDEKSMAIYLGSGDRLDVSDGAGSPMDQLANSQQWLTNADGSLQITVATLTNAARNVYLNVVLPNGKIVTSPVLAFAA